MREDSARFDVTRRTIMKTVGIAAAVANLGDIGSARPDRTAGAVHPTAVNTALDRCETVYAPDPRVAYYDVEARENGTGISLHGAVQSEHLRAKAIDAARAPITVDGRLPEQADDAARNATGVPVDTDDLTVFDGVARTRTVRTAIAPVRDDPDGDSGLLTEALYGAQVATFERESGWTRVRVPDGYLGWIQSDSLTESVEGTFDACLQTDSDASIDGIETLYAGTDCEVESNDKHTDSGREIPNSEMVTVRFRTGAAMELPVDMVVKPDPVPTNETVIANAKYYLKGDVPYLWGGVTTEGIDCSGFVWMAYRMGGLTLPRDSDQQQKMGEQVSRDSLQPGDLLCFPGHIAMSVGGARFIHSSGSSDGPAIGSLDPNDEDYYADLDESFEEARRIL